MGSQGGSAGGTQTQGPKPSGLSRQGSLYNLTLDEVQHHLGDLGKPLGSMNIDELLKTVTTVEASLGVGPADCAAALPSGNSLQRQSSVTLSRNLSMKTVDEVWQDIQQAQMGNSLDRNNQERQSTFGEMTLEDFLVKAGVVSASNQGKENIGLIPGANPMGLPQHNIPQAAHWMNYPIPPIHQPPPISQNHQQESNVLPVYLPGHPTQQPIPSVANQIVNASYPETQMTMSASSLMGTLSDTQTPGRKRVGPDDVVEKSVERRQKRMIKNRESAARSRARKQAYTHELENKVQWLEEENERLKRQREIEKVLPYVPPPEPKYQLRRTSSAPF